MKEIDNKTTAGILLFCKFGKILSILINRRFCPNPWQSGHEMAPGRRLTFITAMIACYECTHCRVTKSLKIKAL